MGSRERFGSSFRARQLLLCSGTAAGGVLGGGLGAPLLPLAARFAQLESVCAQRGGQGMVPLGQGVLQRWPSSWGGPSRAGMAPCHPPGWGAAPGDSWKPLQEGRGGAPPLAGSCPPTCQTPRRVRCEELEGAALGSEAPRGAAKCFHRLPRGRRGRARLCPSCRTDGAGGRTGLSSCHAASAARSRVWIKGGDEQKKKTFQERP